VAADRVLPAGDYGKAELLVIFSRLVEIFDHDDEMIDSLNHSSKDSEYETNYLSAGATS
jgi:hypothetical protein